MKKLILFFLFWVISSPLFAQRGRIRDFGLTIGVLPTGIQNAITDVDGVLVGHETVIQGDSVNTGVTVILPHPGNSFSQCT